MNIVGSIRRDPTAFAVLILAWVITIAGWKLLWFLTDDSFISFRYVSNWVHGIGPTWNPAPFHHVEGYSNFLWVALLSLIWTITGLTPPQIANVLLLTAGLATVWISNALLMRVFGSERSASRNVMLAIGALLICTNKTFLTWLSSGLETALFTLVIVWWVWACCARGGRTDTIAWAQAGLAASLLALIRPDGLLFWAVTLGAFGFSAAILRQVRLSRRGWFAVGAAFAIVPLHLLWRFSYYQDWLPNTYYAKVHVAWPQMGLRFLLSYCLEYAVYIPFLAIVIAALLAIRRGAFDLKLLRNPPIGLLLCLAGIGGQLAYYVLIVGGDHFEYRIFHHLVPLGVVLVCAALTYLRVSSRMTIAILAAWLVMQAVIPWTHWAYTKDRYTRGETAGMVVPMADKWPASMTGPVVAVWDRLQAGMIAQNVGVRHQEHKVFYLAQRAGFPSRAEGASYPWSDRNVIALGAVGVPGWVYANSAVIDVVGLNDRILAKSSDRMPVSKHRQMAHEIDASDKYRNCFRPNIKVSTGNFDLRSQRPLNPDIAEGAYEGPDAPEPRTTPLTVDEIRTCETYPWTPDELYRKPEQGG
jgi:arabinofuranosyltransferase